MDIIQSIPMPMLFIIGTFPEDKGWQGEEGTSLIVVVTIFMTALVRIQHGSCGEVASDLRLGRKSDKITNPNPSYLC